MKSMTARESSELSLCEQSDIFYLLSHHRKRGVLLTSGWHRGDTFTYGNLPKSSLHSKQILNNEEYQLNK